MTKQFCDRCHTDMTSKVSGRLDGVADADTNGNGKVTDRWDLCTTCYRAVRAFVQGADNKTPRKAKQ